MVRWLLLATLLASGAAEDLVFRVPEILVRHAAADRPVGTTRRHVPASNDTAEKPRPRESAAAAAAVSTDGEPALYEEYFVEHDVSTVDARKAARELLINDEPLAGCGTCGRREQQYCVSHALSDHCCCDRRYLREPYPWVPHTCYVGPGRCKPRAADCAAYARLRDCCCLRLEAHRWKGILAGSTPASIPSKLPLFLAIIPWLWM